MPDLQKVPNLPKEISYNVKDLDSYFVPGLTTPLSSELQNNPTKVSSIGRVWSNLKTIVSHTFNRIGHVLSRAIEKQDFNFRQNFIRDSDIAQILTERNLEFEDSSKFLEIAKKVQAVVGANQGEQINEAISKLAGTVSDKRKTEDLELFQEAAKLGNGAANYNLGFFYEIGKGVQKDNIEALKYYQRAAELGNADAQNRLGIIYAEGQLEVPKDISKAENYYMKAVEQNHAAANLNLGVSYEKGWEGKREPDKKTALKYYQRAADLGNATAQNKLGFAYDEGRLDVTQNISTAIDYYKKAAKQGHATANYNLGVNYEKGWKGQVPDMQLALEFYTKAAELGNADAQNRLGFIYEDGQLGQLNVIKSIDTAIKYYRLAAKKNANANYNLGLLYENGKGVTQDNSEALKYYKTAAELGDADAQNRLGVIYYNGQLGQLKVIKNVDTSIYYYRLAAEQNHAYANYNLGLNYEQGWTDHPANLDEAIKYYEAAAAKGHKESIAKLAVLKAKPSA